MTKRYVAILLDVEADIYTEPLQVHPGAEVYRIDGPDLENQIDMALLNDLVVPLKLAFVVGEIAKHYAEVYHGTWIEDGPNATARIVQFWASSTAT